MAEPGGTTGTAGVGGVAARVGRATSPYRAVLASRMRSQRSYRASFRLDLLGSALVGLVELAETWIVFHNVDRLGGLDLRQIVLVFGLADLGYCLADLAFGHCDSLPTYLRTGTLDVFYLRPQPLLLQLVTSDISLRRLGRATIAATALTVGLVLNDVGWSAGSVGLLVVAVVSGAATFAAMFVWAAGAQFFLVDGAEATNAFVYGGRYASTQPGSVWGRPLWLVFGLVFPLAFTGYLPTLTLLGLPTPFGLPGWAGWLAPVAAVWIWLVALVFWRLGVRHYQGGGG